MSSNVNLGIQSVEEKKLINGREKWIDRCRGLAIIIVLLGHTSPPFRKLIYGFHMPLFFILSGYIFYTYNNVCELKRYVKKIANSYLYPYFLFCTINYIITIGMYVFTDKEKALENWKVYIGGILYSRGTKEWMPNCSPLWFLTALFCTMIMLFCIMKLREKIQYIIVVLLLIGSSALAYVGCPKLPWNIDTALLAVCFCYGGIMLARYNMINLFTKWNYLKKTLYLLGGLVVGTIFILANSKIEEVNLNSCIYGNYLFMLLGAFGISLAIILFIVTCQQYVDKKKMKREVSLVDLVDKYSLWMGRHTILVMAFDYQSMSIAVRITRKLLGEENWAVEFFLKMLIVTIVIIVWSGVVELLPKKAKKLLRF